MQKQKVFYKESLAQDYCELIIYPFGNVLFQVLDLKLVLIRLHYCLLYTSDAADE